MSAQLLRSALLEKSGYCTYIGCKIECPGWGAIGRLSIGIVVRPGAYCVVYDPRDLEIDGEGKENRSRSLLDVGRAASGSFYFIDIVESEQLTASQAVCFCLVSSHLYLDMRRCAPSRAWCYERYFFTVVQRRC